MPDYKLIYFNGRGRAEIIRLVFALAGENYEDERLTKEEWTEVKPNTPTGRLPVLSVDGQMVAETVPIVIYLSTVFGLYGKSQRDGLKINEILSVMREIVQPMIDIGSEKDESVQKRLKKQHIENTLPRWLEILEKFLQNNGNTVYVGTEFTLADLMVYNGLETVMDTDSSIIARYPNVKANYLNVIMHPRIKNWLDTRPATPF